MSGINLLELDSSSMMDVIHYLFENDLEISLSEFAEARDEVRLNIYRDLYETDYKYAMPKKRVSGSFDPNLPPYDEPLDGPLEPEGMSGGAPSKPKSYVAPTDFSEAAVNPYNGVLDAPLN